MNLNIQSLSKFISDVELEKIESKTLQNENNLRGLFVSNNRLTEIPAQLFSGAVQIELVDFSNNSTQRIDPTAFECLNHPSETLNHLETLNLSRNQLSELKPQWFSQSSLKVLDLTHNNLTAIDEHISDKIVNLKKLVLAENHIVDLKVRTFYFLSYLEILDNFNSIDTHFKYMQKF